MNYVDLYTFLFRFTGSVYDLRIQFPGMEAYRIQRFQRTPWRSLHIDFKRSCWGPPAGMAVGEGDYSIVRIVITSLGVIVEIDNMR